MKRSSGIQVDRRSLVETASAMVDIPSPTGSEQAMAEHIAGLFHDMGLQVQWQEVEDGRPNVIGTWRGAGGGKTLMFNGHMDTSYSGHEPWLAGHRGFRPEARVEGDYLFGLGISNMKGALACYVEAVRALQAAGVRLKGDVLIAAVVGEIEKTQWGEEFRGKEYRGYAAGSRHLVTHGGVADMCVLGEPTEQRIVLGHYGSIWMRLSTHGPFMHTAFSGGRSEENSILRMRARPRRGARVDPRMAGADLATAASRAWSTSASMRGGFPWRVSRTPERTDPLPRRPRAADDADGGGAHCARRLGARAAGALPRLRDRLGDLRDGARRRDRGGPRARPRDRRVAHARSTAPPPTATRCAGSPTRASSPATGSRP